MSQFVDFLPQIIDGGLGALGIGLVLKLRTLVDSVVRSQEAMLIRLEHMDGRLTASERRMSTELVAAQEKE